MRIKTTILTMSMAVLGLALMVSPVEAKVKEVNVCVGSETGNYHKIMGALVEKAVEAPKVRKKYGDLTVNMINTTGSREILENVEAGTCDFGIAQYDAYLTLLNTADISTDTKKLGNLYPEYVHLLCGKNSGIKDANDIDSKDESISLVPGSGAELTWQAMALVDDDYGKVTVVQVEDMDEAISNVADGESHCTLYVTGLGSGTMKDIDVNDGDTIMLADFDDADFNDTETKKGDPMYTFEEIDSSVYKNLLGWGDADTIVVQASAYGNKDWGKANKAVVSAFRKTMRRNKKWIMQTTGN